MYNILQSSKHKSWSLPLYAQNPVYCVSLVSSQLDQRCFPLKVWHKHFKTREHRAVAQLCCLIVGCSVETNRLLWDACLFSCTRHLHMWDISWFDSRMQSTCHEHSAVIIECWELPNLVVQHNIPSRPAGKCGSLDSQMRELTFKLVNALTKLTLKIPPKVIWKTWENVYAQELHEKQSKSSTELSDFARPEPECTQQALHVYGQYQAQIASDVSHSTLRILGKHIRTKLLDVWCAHCRS